MRTKALLICEVCVSRNYTTTKPKLDTQRLILRKYCPKCNAATIHRESR